MEFRRSHGILWTHRTSNHTLNKIAEGYSEIDLKGIELRRLKIQQLDQVSDPWRVVHKLPLQTSWEWCWRCKFPYHLPEGTSSYTLVRRSTITSKPTVSRIPKVIWRCAPGFVRHSRPVPVRHGDAAVDLSEKVFEPEKIPPMPWKKIFLLVDAVREILSKCNEIIVPLLKTVTMLTTIVAITCKHILRSQINNNFFSFFYLLIDKNSHWNMLPDIEC